MPAGAQSARGRRWEVFRSQFKKTSLCRFYLSDACGKGKDCLFAHCVADLQDMPDLKKTTICKRWKRGACPLPSEGCQFAHGEHELRMTNAFAQLAVEKQQAPGKSAKNEGKSAASTSADSDGSVELDMIEDGASGSGASQTEEVLSLPASDGEPKHYLNQSDVISYEGSHLRTGAFAGGCSFPVPAQIPTWTPAVPPPPPPVPHVPTAAAMQVTPPTAPSLEKLLGMSEDSSSQAPTPVQLRTPLSAGRPRPEPRTPERPAPELMRSADLEPAFVEPAFVTPVGCLRGEPASILGRETSKRSEDVFAPQPKPWQAFGSVPSFPIPSQPTTALPTRGLQNHLYAREMAPKGIPNPGLHSFPAQEHARAMHAMPATTNGGGNNSGVMQQRQALAEAAMILTALARDGGLDNAAKANDLLRTSGGSNPLVARILLDAQMRCGSFSDSLKQSEEARQFSYVDAAAWQTLL